MTIRLPAAVARDARPDRLCNLDRLIATMAARNLDGVVAYLRQNVFYLSGFAPPSAQSFQEGSGYAAVVINRHRPEDAVVVVADYGVAVFLSSRQVRYTPSSVTGPVTRPLRKWRNWQTRRSQEPVGATR